MAGKFEGVDFYNVDSLLSEEERMVRDMVRDWVEDRLMPLIGEAYIERRFPKEIIPELGELGLLGANLPEEYGCAGLNNVSYGLINQELERGDSGVRSRCLFSKCAQSHRQRVMFTDRVFTYIADQDIRACDLQGKPEFCDHHPFVME